MAIAGPAGGWSTRRTRARLDRGAGDAPRPVAAALPLVLRHDAGDVEAPRRVLAAAASRRFGRRGLPYLVLFQVLLPLLAPVVDVFALYGCSSSTRGRCSGSGCVFRACSSRWAGTPSGSTASRCGPLWALPLQQFVYRQLMYLVVIQSVITAIAGIRLRWHPSRAGATSR